MVACSRPNATQVERVALLKFENLSADPALDWITTAAPAILAAELTGGPRTLPLAVETMRDARLENATRIVHGYFDRRDGKLHFEVALEDPARRKMVSTSVVEGAPLEAMSSIANKFSSSIRPFSTSNADAAAAWGRGDYEGAVGLDPDFGTAWLTWTQKLANAGDSRSALDVASRALMRTGLRSPIERTQIELLSAALTHNDAARRESLQKLAQLAPADPAPQLTLAQLETAARHFPEAARAYRDAIQAGANAPALENQLGYAEALAGNLGAARKAFESYGREPENATNALDSLGEGFFVNGKFAEAEKAFLDAHAKDPAFLNGDTLWKAAHARWLGGDLRGADELLTRYWPHASLASWRHANWLYETGRREQAVTMLMESPPEAGELARKQLAIWNDPGAVPSDLEMLRQAYERSDPVNDGLVRTFYAAALMKDGRKDEARTIAARWPLPLAGESLLQSLMYPQYLELRKALQ
jgi:tetratricopeptide (TPR) repeat protein